MATPPDFTAGQVLTAAQMNAVGLWLVKEQTIPVNVSSVTITDAFSADYDDYLVTAYGISIAGTAQPLNAQLRSGSTTTTTNYYSSTAYASFTSSTWTVTNTNNGSSWWFMGVSAGAGQSGHAYIYRPFKAERTGFQSAFSYDFGNIISGGYQSAATSFDQLVLTPSSTNLQGGTVRIYGIRTP